MSKMLIKPLTKMLFRMLTERLTEMLRSRLTDMLIENPSKMLIEMLRKWPSKMPIIGNARRKRLAKGLIQSLMKTLNTLRLTKMLIYSERRRKSLTERLRKRPRRGNARRKRVRLSFLLSSRPSNTPGSRGGSNRRTRLQLIQLPSLPLSFLVALGDQLLIPIRPPLRRSAVRKYPQLFRGTPLREKLLDIVVSPPGLLAEGIQLCALTDMDEARHAAVFVEGLSTLDFRQLSFGLVVGIGVGLRPHPGGA